MVIKRNIINILCVNNDAVPHASVQAEQGYAEKGIAVVITNKICTHMKIHVE